MKNALIKISPTILMTFFVFNLTFGQALRADGEIIEQYRQNNVKADIMSDSLIGEWELINIISYSNGTSHINQPSSSPNRPISSNPPTTIKFDTLQIFNISQWCMKCPYIKWTGNYKVVVRTLNNLDLFFVVFIEQRDKSLTKNQVSFTAEFNGQLTHFENDMLILTDIYGSEWVYKRNRT